MLIHPHPHQAPAQHLALRARELRLALADYCRADGALEAAWTRGTGDFDTLSAASTAAALALQAAYTACALALRDAPNTAAAILAEKVMSEAEKVARASVITLSRGEVADVV